MNGKILGTFAIVVGTAVALFYLTISIAVDAIDDFIEVDIAYGNVPDVSIVNYILAIYTMMIAGTMIISAAIVSTDVKIGAISIITGGIIMLIIVFLSLLGVPTLQMTPDKWLIAPALYVTFVLRDPGMFLFIETACFAGSYLLNSSIHEVAT